MLSLYLDTNALVKLYVGETHSEAVRALVDDIGGVCTSAITYPEARGVLSRALRGGILTETEYADTLAAFEADWETLAVIDLTERVYRRAGDLMSAHPRLRGMDAIQLASVLEARQDVKIRFLTFDEDLLAVAEALLTADERVTIG